MGFGFNLFFVIILLPLTGALLVIGIFNRDWLKFLGKIWLGVIGLITLVFILRPFKTKKILDRDDYYGSYIINRKFYRGKQADWQYNHFRFEIKENDSIYFYVTDKERVVKTYTGTIKTLDQYQSARLVIKMGQSTHHILASNPTIYRRVWSFYMVFYSEKYNNMFFEKGEWKPIKNEY